MQMKTRLLSTLNCILNEFKENNQSRAVQGIFKSTIRQAIRSLSYFLNYRISVSALCLSL